MGHTSTKLRHIKWSILLRPRSVLWLPRGGLSPVLSIYFGKQVGSVTRFVKKSARAELMFPWPDYTNTLAAISEYYKLFSSQCMRFYGPSYSSDMPIRITFDHNSYASLRSWSYNWHEMEGIHYLIACRRIDRYSISWTWRAQ